MNVQLVLNITSRDRRKINIIEGKYKSIDDLFASKYPE